MVFTSWLKWLKADRRDARKCFRPRLDVLEDRNLPSTYMVSNLADSGVGSLRQAVINANAHAGTDVIQFKVTGTVNLSAASGPLSISDNLKIDGPGQGKLTIDGGQATRVFAIGGGAAVTIDNLTIANGAANDSVLTSPVVGLGFTGGGGILVSGGSLTVDSCALSDNLAHGAFLPDTSAPPGAIGGAILVLNTNSSLKIRNSTFVGNQAVGTVAGGGAIAEALGSTATVDNCTFSQNTTTGLILSLGGALASDAEATLRVNQSRFINNTCSELAGTSATNPFQGFAEGGAMAAGGGTQTTVDDSVFTGNQALGGNGPGETAGIGQGGALFLGAESLFATPAPATLNVDHSEFIKNFARGGDGSTGVDGGESTAGAIQDQASNLKVAHSDFIDNVTQGGDGGAGANGGDGRGGAINITTGIVILEPTADISHSTFVDNRAYGGGGANGGNGEGGAIRVFTGTVHVRGSDLIANQAVGGSGGAGGAGGFGLGGGIWIGPGDPTTSQSAAALTLDKDLITANSAVGGAAGSDGPGVGIGGGIFNLGTVTLKKTVVIANFADLDPDQFG
jgi:hypothetical protein